MKKSRTRSVAGEASASPSLTTVQLPLPLLNVLADTRTAFFGLCLEAGQQVLLTMQQRGIAVRAQPGLVLTFGGALIAVAGGLVDLAWVRKKRIAGNEIDPDTLPVSTGRSERDA